MVYTKSTRRRSLLPSSASAAGAAAKRARADDNRYSKKNLLCDLTTKAGLTLYSGDTPNEIRVPKTVFQKQLGAELKNHSGVLLENVVMFLEDFGEYIEDTQRLHKCLMPCAISQDCESLQTSVPDSTVRLFLGVDVIQSPLMTLLLEKLLEFQGEEEDSIFLQGQKIYVPRLLLSQFRFLDRIIDGKELCKKLMEVLNVTSVEVQKEIMACIPDIIEDTEHGDVAKILCTELKNNTELTVPVIDALTYLNILPDLVSEIRSCVLEMLKSFRISDLPIVINFLLESSSAQEALEVVTEIRQNVDFTTSTRLSAEEAEKIKSSIKLTADALKSSMQFQRFVAEAWIKVLDMAKETTTVDVFILFMLHNMNHKKAVESLVRNKIRAGILTDGLMSKVFMTHSQVVRDYFPSVLSLAQALIRSPEPTICCMGCTLYKLAFQFFDTYHKQEIVRNLITHIGSGFTGEIEASLDILSELVKTQLHGMSQFAIFIRRVLDYLDHNHLTVVHIKKLYLLLAQLAFHDSHSGQHLQDDLHIIIRKQLTLGNPRYKRMGVMGAVALVHAISSKTDQSDASVSSEEYDQVASEVVSLLELVHSSGKQSPDTAALFMDSLAAVMERENISKKVESWISNNMTEVFEQTFVADFEEDKELLQNSLLPVEVLYNLNNQNEGSIMINLVPLVESTMDKTAQNKDRNSENSLLCLAPLFHLVTVCEAKQSNDDLESINALLGCPVLMLKPAVYARLDSLSLQEKDLVCASLFFCINWFREVVNSFAPLTDPEMKGKVVLRLKHIVELMSVLKKSLGVHRSFQPPLATFEADVTSSSGAGPSTAGKEVKKGKQKGATAGKKKPKKKDKENSAEGDDGLLTTIDDTNTQSQNKTQNSASTQDIATSNGAIVDLSNYTQNFRELDLKVFTILKTESITRASLDSQMNTKTKEELRIGVPELQFLLQDLSLKLNHSLIATVGKRRSFLKAKADKNVGFALLDNHTPAEVATFAVQLLPCLCDHLESACCFFQDQASNNDGLVDGPGRFSPESVLMESCYNLLLKCLLSLFSWNGFSSEENKSLLKEALKVMVLRMRAAVDQGTFVTQGDSLVLSFKYFGNLVDTVPNLESVVTLLKLLHVFAERCQNNRLQDKLAVHAKNFLSREWRGADGELQKGAKFNELLQQVLKMYLESCSEGLEALVILATKELASLAPKDKNATADSFTSLNRFTFPVYYKVVLAELINTIKKLPASKKSDSEEVRESLLQSWTQAVNVLQATVTLTKIFTARTNLATALKYGRQFVEIFLRQGMPLLDVTFRHHHATVATLLQLLQRSTRIMHHMCGHSKTNKDVALTNQVPLVKRVLEAFVYRVKAMLTLNNCLDAFWIGNLKNRNLQGKEILSQISDVSASESTTTRDEDSCGDNEGAEEEDEDDEEVADQDDEDSEVEMDEETDQTRRESTRSAVDSLSQVF